MVYLLLVYFHIGYLLHKWHINLKNSIFFPCYEYLFFELKWISIHYQEQKKNSIQKLCAMLALFIYNFQAIQYTCIGTN